MIDKYNEAGIPEMLERTSQSTAKPIENCIYPRCEECDKYHGHYCTVPMVVSKQDLLLTEALIVSMEKRLTELETLVTDEILGSKPYIATKEEYDSFTPMQKYWYDKSIESAVDDAKFIEQLKNVSPSIDKPVEIIKFVPLKQQDDPENITWADYFGETK